MKKLYLVTVILLSSSFCFSNSNSRVKNNKRLTYEEYITKYGTDDTSLAIIDFYFGKRETAGKGKMSILPVTAVLAVAYPPLGVPMVLIASPIFISGFITCNKYSNKKLTKVLISYNETRKIPKGLRRKVTKMINMQQMLLAEE